MTIGENCVSLLPYYYTMPNNETAKKGWWKNLRNFIKNNTSLTVIIAAALLLELTTGVMYYTAQNIIQETMEQLVRSEMNAIALNIRKQLAKVEVAVNNTDWVVQRNLSKPDSMFVLTRMLVEHNPSLLSSSVSFKPYFYPQKGHWFEPFAVRRDDNSIELMQLASENHDYTQKEFYTFTMENDSDHWCGPYIDKDGAKAMVVTYSSAVHNDQGEVVAVVAGDLSLEWLNDLMWDSKGYDSTHRFLLSRNDSLLAGEDGPIFRKVLELVKDDSDHQGYMTMTDDNGEKQHVFYNPVGGITRWTLISVCSDREVFYTLRRARLFLLLLILPTLLFAGFIVYRSSRNIERLRKINAEKERIGGELRVANQIQQSMLPPNNLHLDDVNICGSLVPAREVGGDLFDYYIRDEKLFFCIGDVSGKGAPSAMVMGVIHSLFRAFSAHENNPARIMQAINEASCRGNESNIFVTMFIGILDLPTGHLRYCNAGHDTPFILDHGQLTMVSCEPHLPVGVFDDVKYGMQEMHLLPDSTIFLYTDGLTEAKNEEHRLFGLQRVKETLMSCSDQNPKSILKTITQQVHQFVKEAEQSDDLTMLAIHYTPKEFESILSETLTIKNDVHEVKRFSSFMKAATEKMGIETSLARQLRLAVEEAVVNVIDYAYPADTEGDITINMKSDGHTFRFQIIDSGVAFDPTTKEMADTTLSAEDRQIGGLGILLVRELMDSINYERMNGKNILTLMKTLPQNIITQ